LGENLPKEAIVKGFAQHQVNANVLFAGTQNSLFLSTDRGKNWFAVKGELPPVAIDDIKIKMPENHLILGSYGRGIIIHDDIDRLIEEVTGDW
jgi:fructose-1,6-bisphosphatase